jgi:hypothetical protein
MSLQASSSVVVNSTSWKRASTSVSVPETTDNVVLELVVSGSAGTYRLDGAQITRTYESVEYFDGSLPSLDGFFWEGGDANANNARSHSYPTITVKGPRLVNRLSHFLPKNGLFRIYTYNGLLGQSV